jgi:glycosyltransferase involved in cell wall biosynthesis
MPPGLLSVVVPAFNEEEVLPEFHRRLSRTLDTMPVSAEIIYVNDGSRDRTLAVLFALQRSDERVTVLDLSRNFGKEIALTAGLDHARGDAVVVIDADLQDPPELIPQLFDGLGEGYDVVYGKRTSRRGESALKRSTAYLFYRVIQRLSRVQLPEDTGDFRVLSRRAVDALGRLREQHRFMKGLFAWIGFRQKAIPYEREPRLRGTTKWNYWRLWNFALEGITSFTTAPLRIATYVGLGTSVSSFAYGGYVVVDTLMFGNAVAGYPSLLTVILLLGGIQLMSLGVIGEYLGRMFDETKQRPLYLLTVHAPARGHPHAAPPDRPRLVA